MKRVNTCQQSRVVQVSHFYFNGRIGYLHSQGSPSSDNKPLVAQMNISAGSLGRRILYNSLLCQHSRGIHEGWTFNVIRFYTVGGICSGDMAMRCSVLKGLKRLVWAFFAALVGKAVPIRNSTHSLIMLLRLTNGTTGKCFVLLHVTR